MDFLRSWILGISAAAIIGTAATALAGQGTARRAVKLCAALVLCLAMLRPLIGFNAEAELEKYLPDISAGGSLQTAGQELTARIIEEQCAAYIVSKAQALGLNIEAEVRCRDGGYYPEPHSAVIRSDRPLHAKNALEKLIADELAIPAERQNYY